MEKNNTIVLSFVMLCSLLGCSRMEGKKLYAPMTEEQVSALAISGISKDELLTRCGEPLDIETNGSLEEIEFMLSMDNIHAPSDWVMASFIVTVSNDAVVSWKPNSKARAR